MEKVFEEVKKTIKAKFGKDITMETVLNETGIDSLDLLDLVVDLEESNNIKIDDSELMNLKTIKDVVEAISSKL